jgi:broad specificity phosphatase PhoE
VELFFESIGCLADLGLDGWIGSDTWHLLRKPSIGETKARVHELHDFWFNKVSMSSDRISPSHGETRFEQLKGAMADLRDSRITEQKRRQLRADISLAMRRYVNPNARTVKSLRDALGEKIDKRAAKLRKGEISGTERKELKELSEGKPQFEAVQRAVEYLRAEFKGLDKAQKIFTTGEKFRRNILNAWGAVARFSLRHRVLVVSSVTLAFVLGTIGSFIAQRKRDHH